MCSAEDLREYRKKQGWSQWECAVEIGVDQAQVSRWERGKQAIPEFVGRLIDCWKGKSTGGQ